MSDDSTRPISRRTFVLRSGQATALLFASGNMGTLLEAHYRQSISGTLASLTPVTFQLGWLPNVENSGEFVADSKGYFTHEGIKAKILPGGPTTTVEPLVVSGKALVGLSETDVTFRAIQNGAKLKTIAATLQETPLAITSLASKPIRSPKALEGKRFGVQSFQVEVYKAFLRSVGVNLSKVKFVPAAGDPSILASGQVDALSAFISNEPITLELKGIKTHSLMLAHYGWSVYGDTLEVSDASLADPTTRETIVHVLRAVIRGWQDALAHVSPTVSLVVHKYGKQLSLDSKQQTLELKALAPLIKTPYTAKHGLLKMSPAGIRTNLKTLKTLGLHATASQLFDTSVLADAYKGATSIK
jgi:ABC-type nitrate/sulfonate/bicarbonate transport system substrate-binding protein